VVILYTHYVLLTDSAGKRVKDWREAPLRQCLGKLQAGGLTNNDHEYRCQNQKYENTFASFHAFDGHKSSNKSSQTAWNDIRADSKVNRHSGAFWKVQ
jgi:hypothetical protein